MWDHHMQWHGWEHHIFGWWGIIFLLVLVVLIAVAVAVLARSGSSPPQTVSGPGGDEAMEVLRRRYAEGEIAKTPSSTSTKKSRSTSVRRAASGCSTRNRRTTQPPGRRR